NPNYDESEHEPAVLPARIPNLLINGSSGIAVGMATNIPPHNLTEIITACIALIENPEINLGQLMQIVPGPDFPTAGIINGAQEIVAAYKTGRGRLHVRARTHFEDVGKGDRQAIIITVALVDGQPRLLSLKEMLDAFLRHRREVVTRRTVFELRKARERGHILEGLAIALANIDEIIAAIKASPPPAEAKVALG